MSNANPFPDHFSRVATDYSAFRPLYPGPLFDALARLAPSVDMAWDCAAGTGQASLALGARFSTVIATDASSRQILQAPKHPHVHYAVALAEACPLQSHSVSLVTVAQALHWFDVNAFYREAKRVLMPGGLLAVWAYELLRVDGNVGVERLVAEFSGRTLGGWWPPERRHVEERYENLPFPFERVPMEPFEMTAMWTVEQLVGYLRTWSSVSRKKAAEGVDPVAALEPELRERWGSAPALAIRWPLTVLAGR